MIWALVYKLNIWDSRIFPSPLSVIKTLIIGFADGSFIYALNQSITRLLIGYFLSLIIGISLGILMGRIKWFDDTMGSLFLGMLALPSVCWIPLAILWFGVSEISVIFIIVIGSTLSISISTKQGMGNILPIYLKAAKTMGSKGLNTYTHVVLPASLPSIISGMKIGWSFAWRSLMAAELIYAGTGLGHLLNKGRDLNDMSLVIAVMIVIVVIGIFVDKFIFTSIEKRMEDKWGFVKT